MDTTDLSIISFEFVKDWEDWLAKNHSTIPGIWIRFSKKNSSEKTISYTEALDTALCYGWIDSQLQKYDEMSYLQKFTPRRSKSIWSKNNTNHIKRLIKAGAMKPSGLKQVADAKRDGRWNSAYLAQSKMQIPEDFLKKLSQNEKAQSFFKTLSKSNIYAITFRLQTARKLQTREKRMKAVIEMLERNEKFHE